MTARSAAHGITTILVGMGIAFLASSGDSLAQKGRGKAAKEANNVAKQEVKLTEAEVLREAYILLAAAKHDYKGQRAKAMKHLETAIKTLDASVRKKGTAQQKTVALAEELSTAQAKVVAKYFPKQLEAQAFSDALLGKSAEILAAVQPVLQEKKQMRVLPHVVNAEKEIVAALKIR